MNLSSLLQFVLSGATSGCIYTLVAIGIVLCASATNVINFAQGEFVMLGGLVGVSCVLAHVPIPVAIVAAAATGAVIAVVQERLTIAPIRNAAPFMQITVTLGVAVCIRGAALLIWGKDPYGLPGFSGDGVIEMAGAFIPIQALWVWAVTTATIVAMFWYLSSTRSGRAIRAVSTNPVAARLMGINTGLVSLAVFTAGGAMGGLAGIVIAPITTVSWDTGLEYSVKGFTAAIIGGLKSPGRAAAIAFGIGIVESLAAAYISSGSKDIVTYGALLLYLMARGGVFTLGRRPLGANEQH
jgi:branched-subunit amino acid ABC-type transport system permease component